MPAKKPTPNTARITEPAVSTEDAEAVANAGETLTRITDPVVDPATDGGDTDDTDDDPAALDYLEAFIDTLPGAPHLEDIQEITARANGTVRIFGKDHSLRSYHIEAFNE